MPLILTRDNAERKGRRDVLIVLGPDNIERMKEKDPFELHCWELPFREPFGVLTISYATDAEITQMAQLARQGKTDEAMKLAAGTTAGFRYRPEAGDHDLGPEHL